MSGATVFARPRPPLQGPLEKRLALEDNRRIVRSVGAGQVFGAWIIAWALTTELPIPPILGDGMGPEILVPDQEPVRITFDSRPRDMRGKPVKVRPHENKGPKSTSRNPSREGGQMQVRRIESSTGDASKPALAILGDILKSVDLDKIEAVERLTRTEPTRFAGRKGIKREGFDMGYSQGDGSGTEIDLRAPNSLGRIEGTGPRESGKPVFASSIDVSNEGRFRSSESILAVVRSHSPGLRHLYNTHLKAYPGLMGKVTVRFAISPSGLVVDAAVDRSTTGSPAFEREVLEKIRSWRFDPIKAAGNDIVTVPFNFSE